MPPAVRVGAEQFVDGPGRGLAFGGGVDDHAIVACPGANGTLTVLGSASTNRRIVTARLLADGAYDTSFSDDGKESFDLPGTAAQFTPGLCQADGHMVVARSLTAPDGEQNLQIFRVLKHTGLPDPDFGNGGVVTIDLDQSIAGLGREEMPLGVNVLSNGDIAVSGGLTLAAGDPRGFVVLLAGNGTVRRIAALTNLRSRHVTTIVDAPDGRLWAFGLNGRVSGAYRATLNRTTLAWEGVLEYLAPAGQGAWVGAGRAVDAQTVVLAASSGPRPGYDGAPQLLVFRASQVSALPLPEASLGATALAISPHYGEHGVTILPQRRALFGAVAHAYGDNGAVGIHFAMAQIGTDPADDRVDPSFGIGGAQTAAFRGTAPGCSEQALHGFGRLTLWSGRPVFVGWADTNCSVTASDDDYLIARLHVDALFADGFD